MRYYSIAEVAKEFGVSVQTVRTWFDDGVFSASIRLPHGTRRISEIGLQEFRAKVGAAGSAIVTKDIALVTAMECKQYVSWWQALADKYGYSRLYVDLREYHPEAIAAVREGVELIAIGDTVPEKFARCVTREELGCLTS